jgi:hypothetical protein
MQLENNLQLKTAHMYINSTWIALNIWAKIQIYSFNTQTYLKKKNLNLRKRFEQKWTKNTY